MAPGRHEIQVKAVNIKKIFETMEYRNMKENCHLAEAWLANEQVQGPVLENLKSFIAEKGNLHDWMNKSFLERCLAMERFAKEIEKNSLLICQLEVLVRGILENDTKTKSLPLLIDYLHYYVSWPINLKKGLAFSIVDDDCFLGILGSVLGPALAAGCNLILHTEPKIGAIVSLLIQLAEKAGIPKGTLSHITGNVDYQSVIDDELINFVLFPGNLNAPKFDDIKITKLMTIVGVAKGKTPMIVFNTADLDSACDSVIDATWGYGAILPWSLNSILVQEDVFEVFTNKLKGRLSKVKMGLAVDKLADVTFPAVEGAFKKLQKTLLTAKTYGIEIFQNDPTSEQFQPTLLIGGRVSVNNVIVKDEDSMALSVVPFRTTNEAVKLANNSRSGLAVSVWTENIGLANEAAAKLNFSNVWINTFGNFSASISFSPYKDGGIGFIGGQEGFYQYQNFISIFYDKVSNPVEHTVVQGESIRSFYGGSFKKSESGIHDGIFEVPVAKDFFNAVEAAQKGFDLWKKETPFSRNQTLKQLALEIDRNKILISLNAKVDEDLIEDWIAFTYEAFSHLSNTGSVIQNKHMCVKSVREPLGVIVINEVNEIDRSFLCIIASLILGNSIIILNHNKAFAKFYVEICKLLILLKFPTGVFNVILNCNEDVVKSIAFHKELTANIVMSKNRNAFCETKLQDFKQVCVPMDKWSHILYATRVKNVWCNVGDSV